LSHWGLKKKGIEPLYPDEWNTVLDALDQLFTSSEDAVKKEDLLSLPSDIIPDADAQRNLGSQDKAWNTVNAHTGNFLDSLFVQGKPVLKDGDPITVADLGDSAVSKITQAVNNASVAVGNVSDVVTGKVSQAIDNTTAAQRIGSIWDKWSRVYIDPNGYIGVVVEGGGAGGTVTGTVTVGDLGDDAVAKVAQAIDGSDVARIWSKVGLQRFDPRGYVKTSRRSRFERTDEVVGAVELEGAVPLNAGFDDYGDYLYIDPNSVAAFKNLDIESEVRVDGKLIAKAIALGGKLIVNGVVEID